MRAEGDGNDGAAAAGAARAGPGRPPLGEVAMGREELLESMRKTSKAWRKEKKISNLRKKAVASRQDRQEAAAESDSDSSDKENTSGECQTISLLCSCSSPGLTGARQNGRGVAEAVQGAGLEEIMFSVFVALYLGLEHIIKPQFIVHCLKFLLSIFPLLSSNRTSFACSTCSTCLPCRSVGRLVVFNAGCQKDLVSHHLQSTPYFHTHSIDVCCSLGPHG